MPILKQSESVQINDIMNAIQTTEKQEQTKFKPNNNKNQSRN